MDSVTIKFEINEYNIMERFCLSMENRELSDTMYYLIKGKGAFGRFEYNIQKYNIEKDSYKFRREALEIIAIEWCEGNGIDYER